MQDKTTRTYSQLSRLETFSERLEYLTIKQPVAKETFGYERRLNQMLYRSPEWRQIRNEVIVRDGGCDLGIPGMEIWDHPEVHHIVPITALDILERNPCVFDKNNLITVSAATHKQIHYGDCTTYAMSSGLEERTPGDTCPWKRTENKDGEREHIKHS